MNRTYLVPEPLIDLIVQDTANNTAVQTYCHDCATAFIGWDPDTVEDEAVREADPRYDHWWAVYAAVHGQILAQAASSAIGRYSTESR
jgi:hypothetical protein